MTLSGRFTPPPRQSVVYGTPIAQALPGELASTVASISGLSSLATPRPLIIKAIKKAVYVPIACWVEVNAITSEESVLGIVKSHAPFL